MSDDDKKTDPLLRVIRENNSTSDIAILVALISTAHQKNPIPTCIVYVACDAASLARDGKFLLDVGFKISRAALFDCFAQTTHYETIIFFEKG